MSILLILSSSNLIEYLQQAYPVSQTVVYHYCEFGNASSLEPETVVGSLVRQLAEQLTTFPQLLRHAYHKLSRNPPALGFMISLLQQLVESYFRNTYVVIDGVDECPNREPLLQALHEMRISADSTTQLQILVSSRPDYDLLKPWSFLPSFTILPEHVEQSLIVHVNSEIGKISKLRQLPTSMRVALETRLVSRADGMFRWVQCQLDGLRKIRTHRELDHAIRTLPVDLFETYDRALNRIPEQDHDHVICIFKWLVGSQRPLNLQELAEAIAIDPCKLQLDPADRFMDPEEILELCGSLITVQPDGIIALAHFSVREYLLSDRLAKDTSGLVKFALKEISARQYVSQCLLTYNFAIGTHIQELNDNILDETRFPLLQYTMVASTKQFKDFETMRPWVEAHFPSNDVTYHKLDLLVRYAKPPAPNQENYMHAWSVRSALQCAFMCYWNGNLEQECNNSGIRAGETFSNKIGSMFYRLQYDW
jgi:hypothetical protein